jgi:hypothetical protein
MIWLPVMTLSDGTVIEMRLPSPEEIGHEYRVRGRRGVAEFSTLAEVVSHILRPGSPSPEELLADSASAPAAPAPPLPIGTTGRRSLARWAKAPPGSARRSASMGSTRQGVDR